MTVERPDGSMKELLKVVKRFVRRLSERRRSKPVIEISPEAQVEIERRRGPQWPL